MPRKPPPGGASSAEQASLIEPLEPSGERLSAIELTERLGLWERPSEPPPRPLVRLNMIATADGRATLSGKSGPISGAADRQLFGALRATSDAVLVGAGTVRTERYGRLLGDASLRELRERRGLSPEPLACIVSGRLMLPEDLPLLRQPDTHVVALTASEASLPELGARVDYVRTPGPQLDLPAALAELAGRFAVTSVLCEGGPHLAWQLLDAGLLDEIFLTIAPLLAGGDPSGGEALRMLAGGELDPLPRLDLLAALRSESYLFVRYAVTRIRPSAGPPG
jgi:5-amino-6-(5-phosphoribosylamino)uracil reductase